MIIPNTTLTDEPIVRPHYEDDCRIVEHLDIAYEADIGTAISVLTELTDSILDTPAPRVGVEELSPTTQRELDGRIDIGAPVRISRPALPRSR